MENQLTNETADTVEEAPEKKPQGSQDWIGVVLGMVTFLLGLGLLIFTFQHAASLFAVSARETLGDGNDVTELGKSFGHVLLRIGLLLVMSVVSSLIAGQGIRLYLAARARQQ